VERGNGSSNATEGGNELDVRAVRDLPRAVARRLVRRAIVEAKATRAGSDSSMLSASWN
jgi:hypothetical protein